MNKEIFYLCWDNDGLNKAANYAAILGVPLAQCQLWTRQRRNYGIKTVSHTSKMLRQTGQAAIRCV